jgi:NADH:ubiquinone oxidoreductase subunit 4 (subunit M)
VNQDSTRRSRDNRGSSFLIKKEIWCTVFNTSLLLFYVSFQNELLPKYFISHLVAPK